MTFSFGFLMILVFLGATNALNCTAEMSNCSALNSQCASTAGTDLVKLCECSQTSQQCFSKLQTACPLARNVTAVHADNCVASKCGPLCDGAPYKNCDLVKITDCTRQAGLCQAAANANNCTCFTTMRACIGDAQLKTCGYLQSFFPEIVNQCTLSKCSASCGAVPGCDFDAAAKCLDQPACATDATSCACLQAKHSCLAPLAQTCDVIRGAYVDDLQTQCVLRANCSTACSRPLPTTCVEGSLVLSTTASDTCNSCTCKAGKATSCTRKRCAAQCKGVTECRNKGEICVKDVKMCLVAPCPQFKCLDPSAPAARNDDNFDGDEVDESTAGEHGSAATHGIAIATAVIALAMISI